MSEPRYVIEPRYLMTHVLTGLTQAIDVPGPYETYVDNVRRAHISLMNKVRTRNKVK